MQDDLRGKEKAVLLPGGWARADDDQGLTKDKLEKYSKGGIIEGTEVKWGKSIPAEIAAALGGAKLEGGDAGISAPSGVRHGGTERAGFAFASRLLLLPRVAPPVNDVFPSSSPSSSSSSSALGLLRRLLLTLVLLQVRR